MTSIVFFYLACLIFGTVFIKKRILGLTVAFAGYALAAADFYSEKMMDSHINYFVLNRMDWTMLEMAPTVVPQYFYGGIIVTCLVLVLHSRLHRLMHRAPIERVWARRVLFGFAVIALASSSTTAAYGNIVIQMKQNHEYMQMSMDEVCCELGMSEQYQSLDAVQATAGKNIVVIYCESLERNYMNKEQFPRELPNLHRLAGNGWHMYDNYQCLYGSGWTVGSLYATQTGLPTIFGGQNKKVFNVASQTQAVSFAGVLKKAGYQNLFLANSYLDFAGTGDLMRAFGYDTIGPQDVVGRYAETKWGFHDKELFALAKEEYQRLSASGQPFNMTMLTIDTHGPKGFPDESLRGQIDDDIAIDTMEYPIASLDLLLGDFISFIEAQPNGKDTVIVILGDHLLMRSEFDNPTVTKLKQEQRNILLMTNRQIEGFDRQDMIAYYDIPSIILRMAEVDHNVRFLHEQVPDMSEQYVRDNEGLFTALNLKLMK